MTASEPPDRRRVSGNLTDLVDDQLSHMRPVDPESLEEIRNLSLSFQGDVSSLVSYISSLFWSVAQNNLGWGPGGFPVNQKLRFLTPDLPPVGEDCETILVGHGYPTRYDLLVLDSDYDGPPTFSSLDKDAVSQITAQVRFGLLRYREFTFRAQEAFQTRRLNIEQIADAVEALANEQEFSIVVARRPRIVPTSCVSPAYPIHNRSSNTLSTAGFILRSPEDKKQLRITAASHAIADEDLIAIGGRTGHLLGRDSVTDSCVVEVLGESETDPLAIAASSYITHGVLRRPPRNPAPGSFDGAASGRRDTTIRGHDPSISTSLRHFATKVYTDSDTEEGDSGAVLFDEDGKAVAVAAYRTAYGENPAYSIWIWASQVLEYHDMLWYLT